MRLAFVFALGLLACGSDSSMSPEPGTSPDASIDPQASACEEAALTCGFHELDGQVTDCGICGDGMVCSEGSCQAMGTPAHYGEVRLLRRFHYYNVESMRRAATIEAEGEAEVSIGGRPFRVQKQFLDDIASQAQAERIADLRKALLVMHGPRDTIVGIDNAGQIFGAARHPKSFISLDTAD